MQLHTGAVGYMDKLLLSLQQRLIGDLKRFVERFSFIGINAALAAFDFCQCTAGQITACKLCLCRKLLLRHAPRKPCGPDHRADGLTVFQIHANFILALNMPKNPPWSGFFGLQITRQAAT